MNEPLSIVIPTLNEADFVGFLLFSLSRQTDKNFEVIVSDGASSDETKQVVAYFVQQLPRLRFVSSQKRSPAAQRNEGAQNAQYERLLFLDADIILPPNFLEKNLKEIKKRRLEVAHTLSSPLSKKLWDQYYYKVINKSIDLMQHIYPVAGGWTIFSNKKLHKKIGGFDERLNKLAEDTDYVSRAVKAGARFGVIKDCPSFMSTRRLELEGIKGSIKNTLMQGVYFGLFGKYKAQEFLNRPYGDYQRLWRALKRKRGAEFFQLEKFLTNLKTFLKEV